MESLRKGNSQMSRPPLDTMVFCVIVMVMNVPEALRHPIEVTKATPPKVVGALAFLGLGDVLATGDFLMGGESVLAYAARVVFFTGIAAQVVLEEQVRRERQTQDAPMVSMGEQ